MSPGYDSNVQCALFYYVKGVVTQSVWTTILQSHKTLKGYWHKSNITERTATDTMLGQ